MVENDKLDRSARYTAKGFEGCALIVRGFPKVWEPCIALVECQDADCDCHTNENKLHEEDTGEGEWVEQDESCGRVIVTMVGDDGKHEIDIEDLKKIDDLDYCGVCGQIGCTHDGRDRD